jgi:hypothetical protein
MTQGVLTAVPTDGPGGLVRLETTGGKTATRAVHEERRQKCLGIKTRY